MSIPFVSIPAQTRITYPGSRNPVVVIEEPISFSRPGLTLIAGRNGEGKTTFMRYLCGCHPETPPASYRHIYLPEELRWPVEMPPSLLSKTLLGTSASRLWFSDQSQIVGLENKPFGTLSKGNKQKCRTLLTLALARENNSDLVCLDEAMSGLDYRVRKAFWAIIATEAQNRHMLVSLHPDDIAATPERVLLVKHGKITVVLDALTWKQIETQLETNLEELL